MNSDQPVQPSEMSDAEWRDRLDPEAFAVLREAATEPAFTGAYVDEKGSGMFRCKGCSAELFSSDTKFDSGTGWPSFTDPVVSDAVTLVDDDSHGMHRTEAVCAKCGGHLGHVFEDGPSASGQRWCINSAALDFEERE
ncbi:unannotated protein [freshwater metagenome]|uniref:peptide-methionine (R)-S-oxide reductase n=1 Tax=freshwater metagenome TaxID=449393 RepID=A0A6J5ZPL9_9ZZZZ|nr:peptide-methionine (R)-S-oxide reductase MsrB [Actinomycetota bacterium]